IGRGSVDPGAGSAASAAALMRMRDVDDGRASWHSRNREGKLTAVPRDRAAADDSYRRSEDGIAEPVPVRRQTRDRDVRRKRVRRNCPLPPAVALERGGKAKCRGRKPWRKGRVRALVGPLTSCHMLDRLCQGFADGERLNEIHAHV